VYPSLWQILIVVLVLVLLFGRGKISELMGDVAKGIKSFKKGISDDEAETAKSEKSDPAASAKTIDHTPSTTEKAPGETTRAS